MTNTFIYTLGNGWLPYNDISNSQKSPSIMKGCIATSYGKFAPLQLFDGTLEKAFGNFYNWRIDVNPGRGGNKSRFIYEVSVTLPELGIRWERFNCNPVLPGMLSERRQVEG